MNQALGDPGQHDWGLSELHSTFLGMLAYIHSFCQANCIEYCLAYGSALGAMRHGSFIPWDDDVDIYMTARNYARFRKLFRDQGDHKNYYLQELGMIDGMVTLPKLRLNGTTYIEPLYQHYDMHHGVYIDIFILHNAPAEKKKRDMMFIANQYLVLKGLSNRRYRGKKKYLLLLALLRLFPSDFLRKESLEQLYRYDNDPTDVFFDSDLRTFDRSFYPQKMIFPARTIEFSGIAVCVPAQLDEYLQLAYGDYMKIPSISDIESKRHAAYWNVHEDFHEYTPATNLFLDENK